MKVWNQGSGTWGNIAHQRSLWPHWKNFFFGNFLSKDSWTTNLGTTIARAARFSRTLHASLLVIYWMWNSILSALEFSSPKDVFERFWRSEVLTAISLINTRWPPSLWTPAVLLTLLHVTSPCAAHLTVKLCPNSCAAHKHLMERDCLGSLWKILVLRFTKTSTSDHERWSRTVLHGAGSAVHADRSVTCQHITSGKGRNHCLLFSLYIWTFYFIIEF